MRWAVDDLIFELRSQDIRAQILFVEGHQDLGLWRKLVPFSERDKVAIYPISMIEIEVERGGERGRAIALANRIDQEELGDRVKFFIDADYSHLIKEDLPGNVLVTDFKDLEAYAISKDSLEDIATFCNKDIDKASLLEKSLDECLRPLGALRIACQKNNIGLSFKKTLSGKYRRYLSISSRRSSLDKDRLLRNVMKNGGISESRFQEIKNIWLDEVEACKIIDVRLIVQGKDLGGMLGVWADSDENHGHTLVMAAIFSNLNQIKLYPNIAAAHEFVRQ